MAVSLIQEWRTALRNQKDVVNPAFQLPVNGNMVTVRFSMVESENIKEKVRDILTEAYEERFYKEVDQEVPAKI